MSKPWSLRSYNHWQLLCVASKTEQSFSSNKLSSSSNAWLSSWVSRLGKCEVRRMSIHFQLPFVRLNGPLVIDDNELFGNGRLPRNRQYSIGLRFKWIGTCRLGMKSCLRADQSTLARDCPFLLRIIWLLTQGLQGAESCRLVTISAAVAREARKRFAVQNAPAQAFRGSL